MSYQKQMASEIIFVTAAFQQSVPIFAEVVWKLQNGGNLVEKVALVSTLAASDFKYLAKRLRKVSRHASLQLVKGALSGIGCVEARLCG